MQGGKDETPCIREFSSYAFAEKNFLGEIIWCSVSFDFDDDDVGVFHKGIEELRWHHVLYCFLEAQGAGNSKETREDTGKGRHRWLSQCEDEKVNVFFARKGGLFDILLEIRRQFRSLEALPLPPPKKKSKIYVILVQTDTAREKRYRRLILQHCSTMYIQLRNPPLITSPAGEC